VNVIGYRKNTVNSIVIRVSCIISVNVISTLLEIRNILFIYLFIYLILTRMINNQIHT